MRNFFLHRRLQKFGVKVGTFWRRHKVQSTFLGGRPFWCRRRHPGHQKLQKEIQKKKKKNNIIHSPGNDTTTGTRDAPTREYRRKFREADLSERDFCTVARAQEREEREREGAFLRKR